MKTLPPLVKPAQAFVLSIGILTVLLVPASADTTAYYRFEEGSDSAAVTSATDSVNGNNLSPVGSPTYSSNVSGSTVPQTGASNTLSATLGGTSYLKDPNPTTSLFGTEAFLNFTIEGFVNFGSTLEGVETIVGKTESAAGAEGFRDGFYLNKFFGGEFRLEVATVGGNYLVLDSIAAGLTAQTNTWYHVAAVGDSVAGTLTLYVDGVAVSSLTGFDGLYVADPSVNSTWLLGASSILDGSIVDQLNGNLDEVRFSNVALDPSQFLNAVPEPSSIALLVAAALGFFFIRRRRDLAKQ